MLNSEYLWARALSMSTVALVCSMLMAFAAYRFNFNLFHLFTAVLLTSVLFVFIGFIGVANIRTFNQYILIIPLYLLPLFLPLLNYVGITNCYLFYILPTQAAVFLFEAAIRPVSTGQYIYAVLWLPLSIYFTYRIALYRFNKFIRI